MVVGLEYESEKIDLVRVDADHGGWKFFLLFQDTAHGPMMACRGQAVKGMGEIDSDHNTL